MTRAKIRAKHGPSIFGQKFLHTYSYTCVKTKILKKCKDDCSLKTQICFSGSEDTTTKMGTYFYEIQGLETSEIAYLGDYRIYMTSIINRSHPD